MASTEYIMKSLLSPTQRILRTSKSWKIHSSKKGGRYFCIYKK